MEKSKESERKREYYKKNKERILLRQKRYYESHKDERKEYRERYSKTYDGHCMIVLRSCKNFDKVNNRPEGDLTLDWVKKQLKKGCVHCGNTDFTKIGLNRIDNSLPHTQSNCEPCCWDCNRKLAGEYFKEKYGNKVGQIDVETEEVVSIYPSVSTAAKLNGLSPNGITCCCNGGYYDKNKQKWVNCYTYGGFKWGYIK